VNGNGIMWKDDYDDLFIYLFTVIRNWDSSGSVMTRLWGG
jgi:hypothetical protein